MNRREALRGLSLSLGYAVSVPSVLSVLQACSVENEPWTSVFLTENEKNMVTQLVDIILPTSDIPGGLEINLPHFVDMMCKDVMTKSDQEIFHQGSEVFSERFKLSFDKDIRKAKKDEVLEVFANYFDKTPAESKNILEKQKKNIEEIPASEMQDYLMYKCLLAVRSFSLLGYYTSEKIGTEVLNFDPIPGGWQPCIPVADIGNSWTI